MFLVKNGSNSLQKLTNQQKSSTIPTLIDNNKEASSYDEHAELLNSLFCSQPNLNSEHHHQIAKHQTLVF